jgi:hypothetical protein
LSSQSRVYVAEVMRTDPPWHANGPVASRCSRPQTVLRYLRSGVSRPLGPSLPALIRIRLASGDVTLLYATLGGGCNCVSFQTTTTSTTGARAVYNKSPSLLPPIISFVKAIIVPGNACISPRDVRRAFLDWERLAKPQR